MAQNKQGAIKIAAKKIGISVEDYMQKISNNLKWCFECKNWINKQDFGFDYSRYDNLNSKCNTCRKEIYKENYIKKGRKSKLGCRFSNIRDNDKKQARSRVNHLVDCSLIPNPNSLPCHECGHEYKNGKNRHEYHHFKGYGKEYHETVIPLCIKCHHRVHNKKKQYPNV